LIPKVFGMNLSFSLIITFTVMIVFPNAKINLGLNIIEKRPDGYHELETVMVPIPLYDILEITKSNTFEYVHSGIEVGGSLEDNLCVKAYHLINENYSIPPVRIHLRKQIPMGAGLGGGSADATFVLKTLNELFQLNISTKKLQEFAGKLGSDCPFFVLNTPQIAKGRGEILQEIDLDLSGIYLKLVFPAIHISTKIAFSGVHISGDSGKLVEDLQDSIETWQEHVKNDFEYHIFKEFPVLSHYKENFLKEKAVYASMSGSGSTVFGLYKERPLLPKTENGLVLLLGAI